MADDNLLLARLPPALLQRLGPKFETVPLLRGQVLTGLGEPSRHAHFITTGLVSLLSLTADGATLELATIGRDGAVGVPINQLRPTTAYQACVQMAGAARRIRTDLLCAESQQNSVLRDVCVGYLDRLVTEMAQNAACHHFHALVERISRWILTASDRLQTNTLLLTHETFAEVLGVQRTAIGIVIDALQRTGAIRRRRGSIMILNRQRLEASACCCYATMRDGFALTPPPA